ncbi:hypothetical protein E8E14_007807 [Neopestalotiopsis sp. 37M]|nr:hypothetical protein E8E14_007807 [Neopestalotiopsis sp. 37M]
MLVAVSGKNAKSAFNSPRERRNSASTQLSYHLSLNRALLMDLLQRHIANYHEEQAENTPAAGATNSALGKQQISCLNCSQAKTGCDKGVPCQRCAAKGLNCVQRFARRTSKLAQRNQAQAAQAAAQVSGTAQAPRVVVQQPLGNLSVPVESSQSLALIQQPIHQDDPGVVNLHQIMMEMPPNMNPYHMERQGSEIHDQASPGNNLNFHVPMHLKTESPRQDSENLGDPSLLIEDDTALGIWPSHFDDFGNYPPDLFQSNYSLEQPSGTSFSNAATYPATQQDSSMSTMDFAASPFGDVSPPGDLSASNSEPSSSAWGSNHTRATSVCTPGGDSSQNVYPAIAKAGPLLSTDNGALMTTEAAWPMARCTPPIYSGACPQTALDHLQRLAQKSSYLGTTGSAWSTLEHDLSSVNLDDADLASVVPMHDQTRDRLVCISQSFHKKAIEVHGGEDRGRDTPGKWGPMSYLNFPSSKILEYFMKTYVRSLTLFYSLVSAGSIDPNAMHRNDPASIILMLLMIAQGASAVDSEDARILSMGLIEICRISLLDVIDKNVEMSADPTALRAALLFAHLGAWSGDKWLMDIAMGQRGMYLSMLKHAGMLAAQPAISPAPEGDLQFNDSQWRKWLQLETKNRLVYNWVMVDQELSLFHDTDPQLDVSELHTSLPCSEMLWKAADAEQWNDAVRRCMSSGSPQPLASPSLFNLYREFLEQKLSDGHVDLDAHQLRLLLHPIQKMLCNTRQTLTCFSDAFIPDQPGQQSFTRAHVMQQIEVVQSLLSRWHKLAISCWNKNQNCTIIRTNLVLYHLISLNAVTNFPEIESLARKDSHAGSLWDQASHRQRCIYDRQLAVFHCAQVFTFLSRMPADRLPMWWTAAIYRATLILWADSLLHSQTSISPAEASDLSHTAHSPQGLEYAPDYNGMPYLTRSDNTPFLLDQPSEVLDYAIHAITRGASSRFGEGITRKLIALRTNWH